MATFPSFGLIVPLTMNARGHWGPFRPSHFQAETWNQIYCEETTSQGGRKDSSLNERQ